MINMKLKTRTETVIDVGDWDKLVKKVYGRPYSFQQQDGCKDRGSFRFKIPDEDDYDYENDIIPEIVNHDRMGVSFAAWLKRDPKQKLPNQQADYELELWWERNFYPRIDMIINDLYKRGLLDAGEYTIDIDW